MIKRVFCLQSWVACLFTAFCIMFTGATRQMLPNYNVWLWNYVKKKKKVYSCVKGWILNGNACTQCKLENNTKKEVRCIKWAGIYISFVHSSVNFEGPSLLNTKLKYLRGIPFEYKPFWTHFIAWSTDKTD